MNIVDEPQKFLPLDCFVAYGNRNFKIKWLWYVCIHFATAISSITSV